MSEMVMKRWSLQVNVPADNGSVTSSLQRRRCIPLHCHNKLWGPLVTTYYGVLWPQQTVGSSGHNKLWGHSGYNKLWCPLVTTNCGVLWPQQTMVSSGHNKIWVLWPQQTMASSGHSKLWCPLATTNCWVLWPQQTMVSSGHNKLWFPLATNYCIFDSGLLLSGPSPSKQQLPGAQRLSCQISNAEQ